MNHSFSMNEFRDILESSRITCPICRVDIRDSKKNTEINDLCDVTFQNYERCLTESINIDIQDDISDEESHRDTRTVVDDGTALLTMNNNHRRAMNSRMCQGLCCGGGIVFLLVYSLIHIALANTQVHYYTPYNVSLH